MKFISREEVLKFPFSDSGYYKDADKVECYKEYLKDLKVYDFDLNKLKMDIITGLIDRYLKAIGEITEREGRDQNSYILGCQDGIFTAVDYLANYNS